MKKPILKAQNLSVGYIFSSNSKSIILKDLNFDIYGGQVICLMGKNGCGKSTLLKTISGLEKHLSGAISLNGKDIGLYSSNELAKMISVVLTDRMELPCLKVKDVIALGRMPYTNMWGTLKSADKLIINESLEFLDILELENNFFDQLSDGQKQKVLIGRAIAQDTPLLILDEPTTFLDIPRKMEVLKFLNKISGEKNTSIIFSSHDWELVLEMAHQIWIVDDYGRLIKGIPEELLLNGDFQKCFETDEFILNKRLGSFTEKSKCSFTDIVTGICPDKVYWTAHAFNKFNVPALYNKESYSVNVKDDCWILSCRSGVYEFIEIDSLINYIKESAN